jgi:hypothetical protein
MRRFRTCILQLILLGNRRMDWICSMHKKFRSGHVAHGRPRHRLKDNSKLNIKKERECEGGINWLKTGSNGGLL